MTIGLANSGHLRTRRRVAAAAAVISCTLLAASLGEPFSQADEATTFADLVEALLRDGKGGTPEALVAASNAVAVTSRRADPGDPDVIRSIRNIALIRAERGEFTEAVALHQKALAGRRAAGGMSADTADSLEDLAVALIRLERLSDAAGHLEEARRLREAPDGDPVGHARLASLLGMLHRYQGQYAAARERVSESLAAYRAAAPDHPGVFFALQLEGELLFLTGDIREARAAFAALAERSDRALGPDHSSVSRTLRWLALTSTAIGDLQDTRSTLDRARSIADRWLAPCHPETTGLLNDYASLLTLTGDYTQAESVYQRSLGLRQRCLGRAHSLTATLIHNIALLAGEMGDFARAEQLHNESVRIWSSGLGADHPYVGRGLDALAEVLLQRGRAADARRTYARALAIREKRLGHNNPDVAWTLTNLARATAADGDLTAALTRVTDALAIYKEGGLPQEPDHLSRTLTLLGSLQMQQGDVTAARATFSESLAVRQKVFGSSHPLAAESRRDVAAADVVNAAYPAALQAALDAEAAGREHLQFTIRYLPERQAMAYAEKRPRGLDLALSVVAAGHAPGTAAVFDSVIRSRGVILDELIARARSTSQPDPALDSLNATLIGARQRFANLMFRSLQGSDPVPQALLDQARQDREEAERALAERSAAAREDRDRAGTGLANIRRALPDDAALVSFVRYDRTAATKGPRGAQVQVAPSYIAFVARRQTEVVAAIPLGSAAVLDQLVDVWREEARGRSIGSGPDIADRRYRQAGLGLRRETWDKVAGAIGGASRIFIVADGSLNLVSFAALPGDDGRYLVEGTPLIHYLSAERDLMPGEITSRPTGLLAVGGPAFDDRVPQTAAVGAQRSACPDLASLRFTTLPGTLAEVRDIAAMWPSSSPAEGDVTLLSGRAATETGVKQALSGRRVVHLATHGFFLGSECEPAGSRTRSVGGLVAATAKSSSSARTSPVFVENPLLLSGLAFAGANRRTGALASRDDGVLTAEEIAGLNLQGTEWAVLSACDTGVGTVRSGEGVFGLRRAFHIAGARTVIMSLWAVDDAATRAWMRVLYEGRLQKGLATAEAVREASLRVLSERRSRGQSTHPFYWAAFIAAGDWR